MYKHRGGFAEGQSPTVLDTLQQSLCKMSGSTSCVDTLVNMAVDSCCPICRGRIDTVLRIFT